jgi:hypothetical protein
MVEQTPTLAQVTQTLNSSVRFEQEALHLAMKKLYFYGAGTKFAEDRKEDIHHPFVKCPIEGCYYTYHHMCKQTLEKHLKEVHEGE